MKWQYIYELPFGLFYGDDCTVFPERVVCFGNDMPAPYDLTFMNISFNQPIRSTVPTTDYVQCQKSAQWHLARLQQPANLNYIDFQEYRNSSAVEFVVMDTWMDVDHPELEGRADRWKAFVNHDPSQFPAHATHCAGLIGSKTYGTARQSRIHSVQVLNDDGFGDFALLIQAIEYTLKRISTDKNRKYIVSMSLGGPQSDTVDRAIAALVKAAPVVVAAGNSHEDACLTSPSSSREAIVVAASGPLNSFASFSNYGRCVDVIAPGDSILSLCPNKNLCWMSGTSMATPLTAGILGHYWLDNRLLSPRALLSVFGRAMARGVIQNVPPNTQNFFLYKYAPMCFLQQEYEKSQNEDEQFLLSLQ